MRKLQSQLKTFWTASFQNSHALAIKTCKYRWAVPLKSHTDCDAATSIFAKQSNRRVALNSKMPLMDILICSLTYRMSCVHTKKKAWVPECELYHPRRTSITHKSHLPHARCLQCRERTEVPELKHLLIVLSNSLKAKDMPETYSCSSITSYIQSLWYPLSSLPPVNSNSTSSSLFLFSSDSCWLLLHWKLNLK